MSGTADFRWNDLELLAVVCECASLGRASAQLGVSQSTVSRRLVALETALATRLFERTVDGVAPTKAARSLLPLAEHMRQLAAQVTQQAHGLDHAIEGKVRVAMPEAIATFLVVPRLREFRAAYPAIELEIASGIEHVDMARNEADLALRLTRPARGPFVVRRVATIHYGVFANPLVTAGMASKKIALTELDWVTWTASYEHVPDAAWLRRTVPSAHCVLRLQSLVAIAFAVQAGVGAGLLPLGIGRSLTSVTQLSIDATTPKVPLWLVGHRSNRSIARIKAVAEFLTDVSTDA